MTAMTPAAYARHRSVSKMAVYKAIDRGALVDSLAFDGKGRRYITDPAMADREWEASLRKNAAWQSTQRAQGAAAEAGATVAAAAVNGNVPALAASIARSAAAAARKEEARAALAEDELARRRGATILIAKAQADMEAAFGIVKALMLGVPTQFALRRPDLADAVALLDELVRKALGELADRHGRP